ncbi:MAG: hypothetical protein IKK83_00880 [Clostridia bacterium]|nr:hypothetical protein [Clostridia bacterium]
MAKIVPTLRDYDNLITHVESVKRDAEILMEKIHCLELEMDQVLSGFSIKDRISSAPVDELTLFCDRIEEIRHELVTIRNNCNEPEEDLRCNLYDLFQ